MGNSQDARSYFGKQVKELRKRRGWSQSDMAKLLTAKGFRAHTTTIHKIEVADQRSVPIDEAAAIADLFEVSLDRLLGRDLGPDRDVIYELEALLDVTRQASALVPSIEKTLRDGITRLTAFDFTEQNPIIAECERAADALANATEALRKVWAYPSGGEERVRRITRQMLMNQLQKEKESDNEA